MKWHMFDNYFICTCFIQFGVQIIFLQYTGRLEWRGYGVIKLLSDKEGYKVCQFH